jgi:hypothetical protein
LSTIFWISSLMSIVLSPSPVKVLVGRALAGSRESAGRSSPDR